MTKQYEEHAVTELCLFIENTSHIYHKYTVPTVRMLAKHYQRGDFDKALALKALENVARAGAQAYSKEFGSSSTPYYKTFTPADRTEAAARLLDSLMEHIDGRNPL